MSEQERTAEQVMLAKMDEVARALGAGWQRREREYGYQSYGLMGPDIALTWRFDWRDKGYTRALVSGSIPEKEHGYSCQTEIGVSLARPASAIAADIKRRLLPAYIAWRDKLRIQIAREEAAEQARQRVVEAVKTILPFHPYNSNDVDGSLELRPLEGYGTIRIFSEGSITLEVSHMGSDTILALLCTLRACVERKQPATTT